MAATDEIKLDITGTFAKYTKDVQDRISAALKSEAEAMYDDVMAHVPVASEYVPKRKLRTNTPRSYSPDGIRYGKIDRKAGQYKTGFKLKRLSKSTNSRVVYGVINTTDDYRLNVLLDLGHKMPNGGVFKGTQFLSGAQKRANERLKADIDKILEG